ncbi:hypothetical protein HanRHA438_Chr02g0097561 [Helianthus annuus]|nr:hypothetical protein HanRHA438_Chr02g0097561 [Helianthus annuus]
MTPNHYPLIYFNLSLSKEKRNNFLKNGKEEHDYHSLIHTNHGIIFHSYFYLVNHVPTITSYL